MLRCNKASVKSQQCRKAGFGLENYRGIADKVVRQTKGRDFRIQGEYREKIEICFPDFRISKQRDVKAAD